MKILFKMSFSIKSSHEYSSQFSRKKAAPKEKLFDDDFNLSFDTDFTSVAKSKRGGNQPAKLGLSIKQTPDAQADFY
jgi:hypothetical protein